MGRPRRDRVALSVGIEGIAVRAAGPRVPNAMALPGLVVFGLTVVAPLCALAWTLRGGSGTNDDSAASGISPAVYWQTLAWAGSIAVASCAVGWHPGRALRRAPVWIWGIVAGAAMLPSYALFFCGWRVLRPGHFIADWAMRGGWTPEFRGSILWLALVGSSWPLCALLVGSQRSDRESMERTLGQLEPRRWHDALACAWRGDRWILVLALGSIGAFLVGESAAFDAAQVVTWAAEVRSMDASGMGASAVLRASAWPLAGACALSLVIAIGIRHAVVNGPECADAMERLRGRSRPWWRTSGTIVALTLIGVGSLLPIIVLGFDESTRASGRTFVALHGRASLTTLGGACVAGILGAFMALSAAVLTIERRTATMTALLAIGLAALVMPSTILALAQAALWRSHGTVAWVYDSWIVVPMAHAGRYAAVAVAIGLLSGASLPREWVDSFVVHGSSSRTLALMAWPRLRGSMVAGFLSVFALSVAETSIAARLQPPGADWLAAMLLNAIHYQDAAAVVAALPWMAVLVMVCGGLASFVVIDRTESPSLRQFGGRSASILLVALASIVVFGCGNGSVTGVAGSPNAVEPLPVDLVIGRAGHTEGRFATPRAMAIEPTTGCVFVIDKDARVQRFAASGAFETQWRMPKFDRGKPTGISVSLDGRIFVADTHENRVAIFSRDGEWLGSFGSYGTEPGQFVYPCDIAFGDGGEIFVSEYGGNDRVQVFDRDGQFLRQFGRPGRGPGEFARPQSIALSMDGQELFVADSCNHRIQVFSKEGALKRTLGRAGSERGDLAYPYGVHPLNDESILVAEFGSCRIQRLDAHDGSSRGAWGGGGVEPGRLNAPWAVATYAGRVFVLDSGNARVQSMPTHALR